MIKPRVGAAVLAGLLLMTSSPALASDFSGLIYIFVAGVLLVFGVMAFLVWALRHASGKGGPIVDVISALALGLPIAPATAFESYGQAGFTLLPGWMLVALGDEWSSLFPGPAISMAVTCGLFYAFFRQRRLDRLRKSAPDFETFS